MRDKFIQEGQDIQGGRGGREGEGKGGRVREGGRKSKVKVVRVVIW